MKKAFLFLLMLFGFAPLWAQAQGPSGAPVSPPPVGATKPDELFATSNLHAWCVVPFDAKARGPEERVQMLERLGFKRFAYDWRAKDIPTFDAEIEALKRHGIELTAWWSPTNPQDPALRQSLEVFKRQQVHPQLWVMGGGAPAKTPEEQEQHVRDEAERIRQIVQLAGTVRLRS